LTTWATATTEPSGALSSNVVVSAVSCGGKVRVKVSPAPAESGTAQSTSTRIGSPGPADAGLSVMLVIAPVDLRRGSRLREQPAHQPTHSEHHCRDEQR